MYALKPIFDLDACVEVPTCMYPLPVIQQSRPVLGGVGGGDSAAAPLAQGALEALAARQDAILARLGQLKQEVDDYKKSLGLPTTVVPGAGAEGVASTAPISLVLHCPPSSPLYSLPLVCDLLSQAGLSIYSTTHSHSSISNVLPPNLSNLLPPSKIERGSASLRLSLIWSNAQSHGQPQLLVSPLTQSPILGEVNILRYLARLYPHALAYESLSPAVVWELDRVLDTVSSLPFSQPKERMGKIKAVSGSLEKGQFLVDNRFSIGDLSLFSAIKCLNLEKDLSGPLQKWFKSMYPKSGKQEAPSPSKPVKQEKTKEKSSKNDASPKKKSGKETPSSSNKSTDSSAKMEKEGLFKFLKQNGISFTNVEHPEVFTVEAMMPYLGGVEGAIIKNLFIRDKKKNFYLLSAKHDREVNLTEVGKKIGVKDLRFGDESIMVDMLGVKQGSVTPFALVNDQAAKAVKFVCDASLLEESTKFVNFHPMINTDTTQISVSDFRKFLGIVGHDPLKF